MTRTRCACACACACALLAALPCEAEEALALERAVQRAIEKAETGIACVLVSRSELYFQFEERPPADEPWRLGGFDRARALQRLRRRDDERRRLIRSLDLGDPDNTPESYGSGVVIDRAGLVLTCAHVVRGATKVFVRLPGGRGSYADIHALDARSDLAVLRPIDRLADLKPAVLGDGDRVRKGQFVIALANPFAAGYRDGSPTASWGIVGNLRRRLPGYASEADRSRLTLAHFGTLIQTDARLGLGCSGGALVDLKGEVIGLTTARAALVGVETPGGFALPLGQGLRRIVEVLARGEEVEYGFLGVQFDSRVRDAVLLDRVIERSAAHRAGLRRGDYLRSVGGLPVRHFDDVFLALGLQLAGTTVEVERSRSPAGPAEKLPLTLGKFYVPLASIASKRPPARGGLRVEHASVFVQRVGDGVEEIPEGVVVREVLPGSAADRARLRPDRILTHVNGKKVEGPRQFYEAMAAANGEAELTLTKADGGAERVSLKWE